MDLRLKIRYKTRVGMLLGLLLFVLVLNNIAGRERFSKIERTAQSIYKDRLMPSTYIFELREHLDREHALFASSDVSMRPRQDLHNAAMADLIDRYEQTELTDEERTEWNNFKQHLHLLRLNRAEPTAFNEHFVQSLKSLNHLSVIQAGEGRQLKASMSSIASTSSLMSYLEIAIIIIIGAVTLSLVGYSKGIFEQAPPRSASLN